MTPWTVACQAPLSVEFSRQEYYSALPFPTPGNLPDAGIKPESLESSALAGGLFTISAHPLEPTDRTRHLYFKNISGITS